MRLYINAAFYYSRLDFFQSEPHWTRSYCAIKSETKLGSNVTKIGNSHFIAQPHCSIVQKAVVSVLNSNRIAELLFFLLQQINFIILQLSLIFFLDKKS